MDAVWDDSSDGSTDEVDSSVLGSVHRKGIFGGWREEGGAPHCNQWRVCGIAV